MGEPASRDDPLLDDAVVPYDRRDPAKPGNAAIVELRLPAQCQHGADKNAGAVVTESDWKTRSASGQSGEAEDWVERQLKSAPTLTEDRWKRITNLVHRQTTSTRSGEKRPPLRAAGLITAAPSTDSMIARR